MGQGVSCALTARSGIWSRSHDGAHGRSCPLTGRTKSQQPRRGCSTLTLLECLQGTLFWENSPASGGGYPSFSFGTGTMFWTFSGDTQWHSKSGLKDGFCWRPLGGSASFPRPWPMISSSVWLWYKRSIAAWFPALMFLIEMLHLLLGSGLNLTWPGSLKRSVRGPRSLSTLPQPAGHLGRLAAQGPLDVSPSYNSSLSWILLNSTRDWHYPAAPGSSAAIGGHFVAHVPPSWLQRVSSAEAHHLLSPVPCDATVCCCILDGRFTVGPRPCRSQIAHSVRAVWDGCSPMVVWLRGRG